MKYLLSLILLLTACQMKPYWKDQPTGDYHPFTPTVKSPTVTPVSTIGWTEYTVVGNVNIREDHYDFVPVVGVLYAGMPILADCNREDNYCQVQEGYVIKACLGVGEGICK